MQVASSTQGDSSHSSGTQQSHGSDSHAGPLVIFFVCFGVLSGSILRQINKRTGVPYTPMVLVLGIIIGFFDGSIGKIGESSHFLSGMNPHMILFVFIPILLFQSAYNCDWHIFKRSITSILVLAGPGVLIGAALIAATLKIVLFYGDEDLTWYEACALGCILSATDPVAVVALLKQLGASVKFNTLVQGQSLLNDGSAMVFFMVFMNLIKGQTATISSVLVNFVRVSLGGPLLGLLIGFLACLWAKTITRDSVLIANITLLSAFLTFYIAEFTFLKVSGILALVCLGLYFSAVGKLKISHECQHDLHTIWSSIQYIAQTLLFILTGLVVGSTMFTSDFIFISDWVKMLIFWICMIISRGIMVFLCAPVLKKTGYGLSIRQLIVLVYGGLRGTLGMCLALFVGVDEQLRSRFRHLTVFYMCGMAMLTIIVNGLTCGKLVRYVQMIKQPLIKSKLLQICLKKVLGQTQNKLQQLKADPNFSYAKWKEVQKIANVTALGNIVLENQRASNKIQLTQNRMSYKTVSKEDVISEIRFRFIRYLTRIFWEYYQQGELTQEGIQALQSCSNIVNDEIDTKLRIFQVLSSFFSIQSIELLMKFKNYPLIGKYIRKQILYKIYFAYQVSSVFIQACQQVLHKFQESFPLHNDHLRYVFNQVRENIQNAISYINEFQNNYPQLMQAVHTQRASTIILIGKKSKLTQLFQLGYIDSKQFNKLREQIDNSLISNKNNSSKIQQIKYGQIVTQFPIFSSLTAQQMLNLRVKSKEKIFQKADIVIPKDGRINSCYILISGSIKQQFKSFYLMRSIGCIINPFDFTYKQPSKCQAKARNTVKILQIESQFIEDLLKNNNEFKKRWYKSLFIYCNYLYKGIEDIFENYQQSKYLRRFIQAAEVVILLPKQALLLQNGGFIFSGEVESQRTTLIKGSYILPGKTLTSLTQSIVMKFKASSGKLHHKGGRLNSHKQRQNSIINEQMNE